MADEDLLPLRTRAYQLADTGRYRDWDHIASKLREEGVGARFLRHAGQDVFFKIRLGTRLNAASRR